MDPLQVAQLLREDGQGAHRANLRGQPALLQRHLGAHAAHHHHRIVDARNLPADVHLIAMLHRRHVVAANAHFTVETMTQRLGDTLEQRFA